jgi:hypothetical protein
MKRHTVKNDIELSLEAANDMELDKHSKAGVFGKWHTIIVNSYSFAAKTFECIIKVIGIYVLCYFLYHFLTNSI